uniref:Reverse transcriptase domain-containing protein n=1 Tax=Cannabis sativa TaxID=3483 RepID=A0A803PCV1_CANSA
MKFTGSKDLELISFVLVTKIQKKIHRKASIWKKNNFVRSLTLADGSIAQDSPTIFSQFLNFYTHLFHTQGVSDIAINSILNGITTTLSSTQIALLSEDFTEIEIKQAMFSLSGDKAPGPDGLNSLFYQKNWHILGFDLCRALLQILNHNGDISLINDIVLVLISKKKTPKQQITDNILIANEIIHAIHTRRTGKTGWAAIKLDMEKAFDRVEWKFLNHLLLHVGFPTHFISLIMKCLSTVTSRLSLNGSMSEAFHSSRGIRQGDPLSPYIFLLVAEGLSASQIYLARNIWKHSKFKNFHNDHRSYDIKDYYLQALQLISTEDLPLFVSIIWHIWNTRNSILFRNSPEPNNVEEFVCNYLRDYREAQHLHSQDISHSTSHQHLLLSFPEIIQEDTPALYVDAALDQDRCITRLGFVFKVGSHRIIDSAKIQKPGASSPIFTEAQALYHGLSWCLSSQLMPRFIFSDCLNLISKVNGTWKDNSALSSLVAQIRLSFSNFHGVSFLHLPRQLNTSAHSLAKEAIRMREDDHEDSF